MLDKAIVRLVAAAAACTFALTGCGSSTGDEGEVYKIAFQGPLSGDNVQLGQNMENGIKLAIEEANKSGDLGFGLEYFPVDDQGLPSQATSAAQKAIDDPDVVAMVGPAFSGSADTAAELFGAAGLVAVSPSATRADLTTKGYETFLRAVPNDSAQGAGMAKYLAEEAGAEKVVVVDDKTDYGVGLADVAEKGLKAAGVKVVRQSVPQKTPDYSAAARNVVRSKPDAMVYAGYYQDAGPFARKLAEAGFDGLAMSGDGTNDAQFVKLAGKAADGWYLTCPCTDATEEEAVKEFAADYEKAYGRAPGTYSAESYDVTRMIIEEIGKLHAKGGMERKALAEALRGATYKGLTKEFSFDAKGEFTNQSVYLYRVEGEEIVYQGGIDELVN